MWLDIKSNDHFTRLDCDVVFSWMGWLKHDVWTNYFWLQSGSKFTNLDVQIISCHSRPYPPTVHQEDMEYSQHWPILRWGWPKALRFLFGGDSNKLWKCSSVETLVAPDAYYIPPYMMNSPLLQWYGWIFNCITKFGHLQGKCIPCPLQPSQPTWSWAMRALRACEMRE